MRIDDTIAAIGTAEGEGGIGVVRISGPGSLNVAARLFTPAVAPKAFKPRRLYYGLIKDPSTGRATDNGYMAYFKAPHSYTGEDTIEFFCHGGTLILKDVLSLILNSGARLARPGEFTKRAFLNGRLDLSQAEAVSDLIRAKTESALASARGRLEGGLSKRINMVKEVIKGLMVRIEAELDFSEEEVEGISDRDFLKGLEKAGDGLKRLISTYEEGRVLKEGVKVIILGRPNVGKSSLLNILLKEERAIVTPVPGTTRDIIEEVVNIKGIPVRLMDSAGLRDTEDIVESMGVERAKKRAEESGLILFVVDSSDFSEDPKLLESLIEPGKKAIVVANKIDLVTGDVPGEIKRVFANRPVVFVSALKEEGIETLEQKIYEEATGHGIGVQEAELGEVISSVRQKDALIKALEGVERAKEAISGRVPKEFIAEDLRWAITRLGEITGEVTTEEILEGIFRNFCIGK